MLNILYTYNKAGFEGQCWANEINSFRHKEFRFIPFNHQDYMDPRRYTGAINLDSLYRSNDNLLLNIYSDFERAVTEHNVSAIVVNNAPPFHPDYLKKFNIYKCLYSADDPGSTYSINIPYIHAYNHVFCVSPSYSTDMEMREKMLYAGAKNYTWMPISVFDFEWQNDKFGNSINYDNRDVDIVYIGGFWKQKLQILSKLKKRYGSKFKIYGYYRFKHNLYVNTFHSFNQIVRPVSFQDRVSIYRRSKIGINLHWNEYGIGNQRLYQLPANGVMQITDCSQYLNRIFDPSREVISFDNIDSLYRLIDYYLENDEMRKIVAAAAHSKVMKEYRISDTLCKIGQEILKNI